MNNVQIVFNTQLTNESDESTSASMINWAHESINDAVAMTEGLARMVVHNQEHHRLQAKERAAAKLAKYFK